MKEVLNDAREGVMHGNSFYGCGKTVGKLKIFVWMLKFGVSCY